MDAIVKVPGVVVTLGGNEYIMAPLTAGPLKQILPRLQGLGTESNPLDALDLAVDVAFHSLKRNYPDIAREQVENDFVDLTNMMAIIQAGAGASGLAAKAEPGAGEA